MTHEQFFNQITIRHKFGHQAVKRVQQYMNTTDLLEAPEANPATTAAALVLLGCTATKQDLQNFGRQLLTAGEPETLLQVFEYIIKDELNAATIECVQFDRVNSVVVFELVDGSDFTIPLNLPVQPAWQERPGVELDQAFLVGLAMDLKHEYIDKGEIVTDN